MSDWKEYKLGDVITLQRGFDLPKDKMRNGKYPVAGSNGVIGWHSEYTADGPGVTIGRSGNIGTPHFYKSNYWAHNTSLFVKDFKGNDALFIYYFLKTIDFTQLNTGSAVPTLNRNHIHELQVSLPPLEEQKQIAGILSSLDDKIDLLHRENATLEALAETLFRHLFIENPCCGVGSADNPIWKEGKLEELIEVKYGKDHKKLGDGDIPVIGSGGVMRYADKALFDGESVLIPRKGSLNNVMYIDEPFWTVDTMFYTKMKIPHVAKFVYQFMKTLDLVNMNVGSAVPSMTAEVLNNVPLEIPSQAALDDYDRMVTPFYKKIKSNQQQIQTLSSQRDTLLPRLMSGEVEINRQ